MVRAGYIRKLAAGIYTYLPLALRVLKKVENIYYFKKNNQRLTVFGIFQQAGLM